MKNCIMRIPTETECYRIMVETGMLNNIVAHSIQVCQVAVLLSESLNGNGHNLNFDLIQAAALLHDITKTRSLKTSEHHDSTGAEYLREKGYRSVADVVGQHVRLAGFKIGEEPNAAEIVNYADKRVMHDTVVSLDERMADLMRRYNGSKELGGWLDRMQKEARAIETKLFALLPFSAGDLIDRLNPDDFRVAMAAFQRTKQAQSSQLH